MESRKEKGQYMTPKRIVVMILDDIGYAGDEVLTKKIMEPSFGDGAFLSEIVKRIIKEGRKQSLPEREISDIIQSNVFGIEKDEKILQQIQSILQKVDSGYELVGTAVNGQSGYELISALRPNLVIMDIELPRMNGMSMLKKLRAEAFDFKVVVLSGTENFQYAKQAIELSVDGYIMKPIRPLELKRALMQICEKMRNEYWLNASFTVENLLIGCMNGQYQPENKLNEITVRNYGFTVEDSCGMFILWLGEDFEKNKAEAVHLLKRSLQKENKFRVCILPLEVWQEIFVIVYQTAEFEMAEQYFQENIVPMLCSNLNGDVVCVWKRIDHMMDLWQYRTKIPLLRQWNLTLGRGVLISEKGIAGRELELLPLKYPAELELRARDCTLAGRKKELEKCFEELCEMLEGQFCFRETLKDCLIRFSLNIVNMYKIQWELGAEIQVLILILEIGQATSWKQIRRAIEELLNYFNFEKEDLQGNEAFSTMVRKAVEMAKKYYSEGITLEETASRLYVSEEYLSTQFKKETQSSFTETVRKFRIEKIKDLLLNSKLKLNQIAELTGYSDPKYMSRVFKEEVGMLPTEFRKKMQ